MCKNTVCISIGNMSTYICFPPEYNVQDTGIEGCPNAKSVSHEIFALGETPLTSGALDSCLHGAKSSLIKIGHNCLCVLLSLYNFIRPLSLCIGRSMIQK